MFTGIIEELGTVAAFTRGRLSIQCRRVIQAASEGTSIAVNGVCLTATRITAETFDADLSPETLERSNLGDLVAGSKVNLERPATPATFLSGHIVQGHVDATGELVSLDPLPEGNWWLAVRAPSDLDRYLVHKGSIAIDGISLTIARLDPGVLVGVAIIPHTYANTALATARAGARLNIEVDVIAKYIEKNLAAINKRE
jgi:riboflavin synthase